MRQRPLFLCSQRPSRGGCSVIESSWPEARPGRLASRSSLTGPRYFDDHGIMKTTMAVRSLAALAQESRLLVFRLLVQKGPKGMHPSDISARLKLSPATLSFHLKELAHAGLIRAQPEGRHIRYSADFKSMNALLDYLTENCCQGRSCEARPAVSAAA
jgi:ArsR family transcriptional regulator, arsenate/arsenite/antimonite-responsive transcriptional repressor